MHQTNSRNPNGMVLNYNFISGYLFEDWFFSPKHIMLQHTTITTDAHKQLQMEIHYRKI